MRAAAILGLGSSPRNLEPFQENSGVEWTLGLPASGGDADVILIFGGDGTVHRHLAALVALKLPVLVVPCGSGNDFARALGLGRTSDALAAWRKFLSGNNNTRMIDVGRITPLGRPEPGLSRDMPPLYFCCAGGIGLDGEIARRANRLPRWLRAHGGYVLSFMPALVGFQPVPIRILAFHEERGETRRERRIFVAVFANAPSYGGGMKVAPRAMLDDGELDVCIVRELPKLRLLCLFPSVYFGRHLAVPEVEYYRATSLRLETARPLDVYADGEYVCRTPVEVSLEARCLRVIAT